MTPTPDELESWRNLAFHLRTKDALRLPTPSKRRKRK